MPSPFPKLLHNATLTFIRYNQSGVDEFGNPTQTAGETLEVIAFLKQQRDPKEGREQGVDVNQIYVEGYAISPMQLPSWVVPGVTAQGNVPGLGEGTLKIVPGITVARELLERTAGTKIRGYFEVQG